MSAADQETRRAADRRKGRARSTARDVPPAVQWHEGMLLAPQHFQMSALRSDSLLHYHSSTISPFHWGLTHLDVDRVLLVDGVFRVLELEAVMPDGLLVHWTAGSGPDLQLDLASHAATLAERPGRVQLAVVARARGISLDERYDTHDETAVADDVSGGLEIDMAVLQPRLQLILGEDVPAKFVSFPLAEIAFRNDVFTLTRYQPPWLRVAPGNALHEMCSAIATRLREKAYFLADQVRSPSTSARAAQLLETKALVHSLVGELPPFEAILRTGVAHPFPLYLALCSLLGHVAGLGRSLVPPPLDAYDHNDLFATFEQVQSSIGKALDEGIHEAYTAYPFVQSDDEFHLPFDADWASRSLILGLRAPSGASDADMAVWLAASVVGGRAKIVSLRDRRIMGLRRKQLDADVDLVPSRGVSLYSIAADPELLAPGEDLVIVNPDQAARRPQEIVLYVRNRN